MLHRPTPLRDPCRIPAKGGADRRRRNGNRFAIGLGLLMTATVTFGVETRQAFVSSVYGPGNFASWPEAELGTSGPEAADSVCRTLAANAGLARPLAYRAWLSSSLDDAWCRVQGLIGTRDSGCSGEPAPEGAGPWARTSDGARWAGTLAELSEDRGPLVPLDRDERGAAVPGLELYWTGTDPSGRAFDLLAAELCDDWTSSAGTSGTVLGSTFETRGAWTLSFGGACSDPRRLVCLETGAGGSRPPVASLGPAALAFVTTSIGTGDFSSWPEALGLDGLAAADSICRVEAVAGHLPNPLSFGAWLSTSARNARSRLPLGLGWRRLDGVGIVIDRTDLIDGWLAAPLNETVASRYLPEPPDGDAPIWTGTAFDGTALPGETCVDWSSAADTDSGLAGFANSAAADWTDGRPFSCDTYLPLYCFSNVEILFWGSFETGDVLEWSSLP